MTHVHVVLTHLQSLLRIPFYSLVVEVNPNPLQIRAGSAMSTNADIYKMS